MKVKISAKALISFVLVVVLSGCGYTAHLKMPDGMQSIYVPNFENAISASERYTYVSGLEIDITNAVIDRILYDGNLKLVDKDFADMILQGKVVRYEQEAVRYNSIEGVQQYRLFVVVSIELVKRESGEVIWEEGNFTAFSFNKLN